MNNRPRGGQVDEEILDAVAELIGRVIALGEKIAERLSVPGVFIKALHILECPMAMKDLGKKMHCDPSFVTAVTDMLEKRGLARREAHPGDRRIKNIVLTSAGLDLKHRIEGEMAARMPWSYALTPAERVQLLRLLRKMLRAQAQPGAPEPAARSTAPGEGPAPPGEVTDTRGTAPTSAHQR